jgi:dihydropteroate synthase
MLTSGFSSWVRNVNRPPVVVGIINVTPDSFSDGGRWITPEAIADRADELVAAGADWLDVGGESTRPGSLPVAPEQQIGRVVPAIKAIRRRHQVLISIDTTRAEVAERAADCGASVVNDISAGQDEPEMLRVVARRRLGIVLMHMQGRPATMQKAPSYQDVTQEVSAFLIGRRERALEAGIDRESIVFDPGIGFGKTPDHDLQLLHDTRTLAGLGQPLLVGPSRKSFIGRITAERDPEKRVFGTAAVVAWCVANGAAAVRVHDVGPIAQVVKVIQAISLRKLGGIC